MFVAPLELPKTKLRKLLDAGLNQLASRLGSGVPDELQSMYRDMLKHEVFSDSGRDYGVRALKYFIESTSKAKTVAMISEEASRKAKTGPKRGQRKDTAEHLAWADKEYDKIARIRKGRAFANHRKICAELAERATRLKEWSISGKALEKMMRDKPRRKSK
jgi:hypothetical protein